MPEQRVTTTSSKQESKPCTSDPNRTMFTTSETCTSRSQEVDPHSHPNNRSKTPEDAHGTGTRRLRPRPYAHTLTTLTRPSDPNSSKSITRSSPASPFRTRLTRSREREQTTTTQPTAGTKADDEATRTAVCAATAEPQPKAIHTDHEVESSRPFSDTKPTAAAEDHKHSRQPWCVDRTCRGG